MRHGTQGHVVEPREPTRRLGGAKEALTCGRGPRESTRTPGWRHVASEGAGR